MLFFHDVNWSLCFLVYNHAAGTSIEVSRQTARPWSMNREGAVSIFATAEVGP
jgi:hypothetical protein